MNHTESRIQQQCIAWFRAEYPEFTMLLTHVANEGNAHSRVSGAIHKAEGTVAGVADLILFAASDVGIPYKEGVVLLRHYHGLGIEMKTKLGKQTQQQKDFQRMFEAAGFMYVVIRSLEEFQEVIRNYIKGIKDDTRKEIRDANRARLKEQEDREREKFYKVINNKNKKS
ncbi:hypothetical protein L6472_05995 [Prevotella sp. E13-17]|uniref:hypothetical protein n=1 Tax=Prevotella sp. E13-17 TaxID=2913616 RepID=UPI001ED9FD3A|nr:hypothetical protein [Prevotella sp. E13-17]UKK52129.1 hypothetical protein L6472_05995 [Prevotella sp. E13-17]